MLALVLQKRRRVTFDSDEEEMVDRLAAELAGGADLEVSSPWKKMGLGRGPLRAP